MKDSEILNAKKVFWNVRGREHRVPADGERVSEAPSSRRLAARKWFRKEPKRELKRESKAKRRWSGICRWKCVPAASPSYAYTCLKTRRRCPQAGIGDVTRSRRRRRRSAPAAQRSFTGSRASDRSEARRKRESSHTMQSGAKKKDRSWVCCAAHVRALPMTSGSVR